MSQKLRTDAYRITLIACEETGVIGVGESTVPYIVDFLKKLSIEEEDILSFANGTVKLGIKFENWNTKRDFIHPFLSGLTSLSIF